MIRVEYHNSFVILSTINFIGYSSSSSLYTNQIKKKFNNDKKKGTLTEHDAKAIQAQTISKAMYSTQQSQGKN